PQYRLDLAETHRSLGWWMEAGAPYSKKEEVEHMRRASELLTKLVADFPRVPLYRYLLATTLHRQASFAGLYAPRIEYYNQAIAHLSKLGADFPQVPEYRSDLAVCYGNFGVTYWMMGDWDKAGKYFRQSLNLDERLAAEYPTATRYKENLSV